MTITVGGLAVALLAFLLWRGSGGRFALFFSALSGAAIGGILVTIGTVVFGVVLTIGSTLLNALP